MSPKRSTFPISPLISFTLVSLYIALTVPLPFLAEVTKAPVPPILLWIGIIVGLLILIGALSERVIINDNQIKVVYPVWFPSFFRKGWSLDWSEIKDLKLRTTGQGGLVYYFISKNSDQAYLLPMRIAGFSYLVNTITEKTGIDTSDVRPLSQPWMYLILLVCTVFLLLIDSWTIWTSINL